MVIRRSSAREVEALVAQLDSPDSTSREGAAARLRVLGARAVPRLLEAARTAPARARVAALATLESIPDPRSVPVLLELLAHADSPVAAAAAAALRPLVSGRDETRIIGALTDVAVDGARDARVRSAALRALGDLDVETLEPLIARIGSDIDAGVRSAARARESAAAITKDLPDDPATMRRRLARTGTRMSIVDLQRLVEALHAREDAEPDPIARREWMTARAVAHQVLAARDSRVALYDLRETLERADGPLPVEFLSAVEKVGDAGCAAALAAAYAKAGGRKDWWTDHLKTAFQAIAKRERLTRRSAALQKLARKRPGILEALLPRGPRHAPRNAPRPRNGDRRH